MEIVSREKLIIESYGEMVEYALSKLRSHLTNHNAFFQQKNDKIEQDTATDANGLLDKVVTLEDNSPILAYTDRILMPDDELISMIKPTNCKQSANCKLCELFDNVPS